MARIDLIGSIPLAVEVDTETGEVTGVHVLDECEVEYATTAAIIQHNRDVSGVTFTEAQIKQAIESAGEADWPAWEFGF